MLAKMLSRHLSTALLDAAAQYPAITLTGPRQSGKTTLVRALFPEYNYLSLEAPDVRTRAIEDPRGLLGTKDNVILDEIQRVPELLSYMQGYIDSDPRPGRFILTGSQNILLMEKISQSLAGRTAFVYLYPFSLAELCNQPVWDPVAECSSPPLVPFDRWELIFKGFYPRIHDAGLNPRDWLGDYFRTYVERDLREVMEISDLRAFEAFVRLAAASTAQELNLSRLASDAGITHQTAKRWLSALEIGFLATTLPPHHVNYRKRLRKRPKLHFLDTGLICYLLDIPDASTLALHPLRGAIFESYVVSELVKSFANRRRKPPLYCWRGTTGHEIDVLVDLGDRVIPVEVKAGETVLMDAFNDLVWWTSIPTNPNKNGLLIHGGTGRFSLKGFQVLPWHLQ